MDTISPEAKAVAEAAIAARTKATDAKKAADDAGGVDEDLNSTAQTAEKEATDAEEAATNLSQKLKGDKVDKLKRRQHFIKKELEELGEAGADDEDLDDPDEIDPNKPLTLNDLRKIEAKKAKNTAVELAESLTDPAERAATLEALTTHVNPQLVASNPQQAFEAARSIANGTRNARIREEAGRGGSGTPRAHGAGAPAPRQDEEPEFTAQEKGFMRPPFSMTKEEILKARGK